MVTACTSTGLPNMRARTVQATGLNAQHTMMSADVVDEQVQQRSSTADAAMKKVAASAGVTSCAGRSADAALRDPPDHLPRCCAPWRRGRPTTRRRPACPPQSAPAAAHYSRSGSRVRVGARVRGRFRVRLNQESRAQRFQQTRHMPGQDEVLPPGTTSLGSHACNIPTKV